jgi:LmbE family N-acetylglucosaminyl deacetylase
VAHDQEIEMIDSRLLVVMAHPDDETFRCGGTLALLARQGVTIQVLTATHGEAGSSAPLSSDERERLALAREQELHCACAALGIELPLFLNYNDGKLDIVAEEKAAGQVLAVMEEFGPQVVITWPPDGLSGHPDHIAVNRWTDFAFRHASNGRLKHDLAALYYLAIVSSVANVLGYTHLHATPDDEITLTIDVLSAWDQKLAAIQCHRTQLASSPILNDTTERQRLFLGQEHFIRAVGLKKSDFLMELGKSE